MQQEEAHRVCEPGVIGSHVLYCGDALAVLPMLAANSVDAVVTDPPAGIGFMSAAWDHNKGGRAAWITWMTQIATECFRCLKPGGHALVWALPRTSHWTAMAWEDAGFEVRDCVYHLFAQGFPKSLNISKALDAMAGAEREAGTQYIAPDGRSRGIDLGIQNGSFGAGKTHYVAEKLVTTPATDTAKQWDGWGSALKPAAECWWLLRKPLNTAPQIIELTPEVLAIWEARRCDRI